MLIFDKPSVFFLRFLSWFRSFNRRSRSRKQKKTVSRRCGNRRRRRRRSTDDDGTKMEAVDSPAPLHPPAPPPPTAPRRQRPIDETWKPLRAPVESKKKLPFFYFFSVKKKRSRPLAVNADVVGREIVLKPIFKKKPKKTASRRPNRLAPT